MATVFIQKRKRKNRNSYVVYYKDPGTLELKYFRTYQRQKDAQDAANDLRTLIDTGRSLDIQKNKTKLNFLTFGEVSEQLKIEWGKRLENGDLRQKTFDEYLYMLNSLNKNSGKRLLSEISEEDILNYRSNVASEFTNVTSNRYLFIIKQVFKIGVQVRSILYDVAAPIKYLSEKEQERNKFLVPSELDRLIEASRKGRTKFYLPALIHLGAEHGASRQEALTLKWSDIDFEHEGQGMIRLFRTKNTRERTEYLMPRTKEALLEWRDHLKRMRDKKKIQEIRSNHVFCRLNGTPIKRFDKAWRCACKEAGIQDLHFHDLRHTFCSNLLLAGSGLKDVKEMIGHNDLSMTDRYSHLTLDHKRLQQTRLAEHYANGN
jgi:integrase